MVLPTEAITLTEDLEVIEAAQLPTKTYKLDFFNGTCGGFIDGRKAMEQAVFKVLNTFRYRHIVYGDDYGFENMVGYDELYIRGDLSRRIQEAVLQDERIERITNFSLEFTAKDEVLVTFTAHTVYGDVQLLKEMVKIA